MVKLTNTNWHLVRICDGTDEVDASSADAGLLIDETGRFSGRGGNAFGGHLLVHAKHLDIRERASHRKLYVGLLGEVDAVIEQVLAGQPAWIIRDDELRIEQPGGAGLTFRARPEDPTKPLLLDREYYAHGRPRRA